LARTAGFAWWLSPTATTPSWKKATVPPDLPERRIVRRCFADVDCLRCYGEVLARTENGDRIVFIDPEHPRLRADAQRRTVTGTMANGFVYCFWTPSKV
jgi:hypothetical protein